MYQIYQVMPGETIESIAQKINISEQQLRNINGISNNMIIRPGSNLIIPSNKEYETYVVKKGDSLYSIAKNYGIDYQTLYSINGLKDGEFIYPNQEIIVPYKNNMYVVKQGDTLNDIIRNTNTSIDNIINKNNNILLKEDQVIKF